MAPLPKNSIHLHLSHPGHPLKPVNNNQDFLCNGCRTPGTGKRYRCNGCDFDLHDFCGTCPPLLSSFMHPHSLTLVARKPQEINRICDVCRDPVEGLFYRCKECEFDVHPLCTQLPERLQHVFHKIHPLTLQSSPLHGFCCVCRNPCSGWRYRCGVCNIDIHLECVLAPVVPYPQPEQINQRVPFQPPPHFAPCYSFPYGGGYPSFGPGNGTNHCGMYAYPQQNFMPQNYQMNSSSSNSSSFEIGRPRKSMFSLVGQLGFGVLSNMIFGVDVSSLFSG